MEIGMIRLGKRRGNMARCLTRDGRPIIGYDRSSQISRQEESYTAKLLAELLNQFGSHEGMQP